eukprot:CAMPEP_0167751836 /NCGR_PEP_ID=MMETSP0110_2-20121227/6800_1 /TAXON_ID=629695 /ORGANISM="Gymnochlora sp., Strain CCMP2014" /LENGTH=368 /DNA_ID=CAMNT_0007637377 /DNA_START=232 /DNA_END=1338 /DNA_ORIENTATION=+
MFARTLRFARQNRVCTVVASGVGLAFVANQFTGVAHADEKPMFVINGFYMSMREKFTTPGKSIYYMTVEWPSDKLAWEDFRGKVLGATDPKKAAAGSVRNDIFLKYKELGLSGEPNTGDNGVHASASPFEALAERMNWLEADAKTDAFGTAMLNAGIPMETITAWTVDPQVEFEGGKASLFDLLEDMNSTECLKKAMKIAQVSSTWGVAAVPTNEAFVFIKPHAVTEPTKALLKAKLAEKGIKVKSEGSLDSKTIDEKKLIDQHYYSIANKATLSKPKDLNPPAAKTAKFAEMFGITWEDALKQGLVYNAADACAKLDCDGAVMDKMFGKAKKAGNSIKFGGGFYCAKIEPEVKKTGISALIAKIFGK